MRVDQAHHLYSLAETHLVSQNATEAVLLLLGELKREFAGVGVDVEHGLVFDDGQILVVGVLFRPVILFPERMHGDFLARQRFVFLLTNHPM